MTDNARTSKSQPPGRAKAGGGMAGDADPIATGLQRLFGAVAEEPVPDEFMALLDRIEAAEREREARAGQAQPQPGAAGRSNR